MDRIQLITLADLTKEEVDFLIPEAENLRDKRTKDLGSVIVASLFYEPSTRTRLSFESAAHRLGAKVITVADIESSSISKGETLADTIRTIEKYADILVMRHPQEGSTEEACKYTKKPFINAGDGANQHPTQALLDVYTIHREMGGIDGLTIAFVGDLKFGRTVHSLLHILSLYNIKKILFISPDKLKMPQKYLDLLKDKNIERIEDTALEKHMPEIDILYMTRIQKERFESKEEYESLKNSYILTSHIVKMGKPTLRIMHPLPRVDEISTDVDNMEQAAYFREAENGIYMRMALLKNLWKNYNK